MRTTPGSESEPESQLDGPGIAKSIRLPELAGTGGKSAARVIAVKRGVHTPDFRMVEEIEHFETERQLRSFREEDALHEGRVHIVDRGQADRVAAEGAPGAIRRTSEGRLIEQFRAARSGIGIA